MNQNQDMRVLIVEDEVLLAVELEHVLEESGHKVVGHAMDTREALSLAGRHQPNLALVDVHLQDGPTGVRAARHLTSDCGAVVLFMTANKQRLPADFAGACGVISKPYSENGVRRAVNYVAGCLRDGRAHSAPPAGLEIAPAYAQRWRLADASEHAFAPSA